MAWALALQICGALLAAVAATGPHHLAILVTGTEEENGTHAYFMIAKLDDFVVADYRSDNQEVRPTQPWVKRAVGSDYMQELTHKFQRYEKGSKVHIKSWMNLYNHTDGLHVEQVHVGCSLSGDVLGDQKFQYAYNGEDFISFDIQQQTWVAAVPVAFAQKLLWENHKAWTQYVQWYLEERCLQTLKSLLQEGKAILAQRVSPKVSVSRRDAPDGSATLSCHVRDFYPRPIHVSWVQEGGEILPETFSSGILPTGNHTFYTWTSLELGPASAVQRCACRVEHSSLPEPSLTWVSDKTDTLSPWVLAVIIVAGGMILVVAVLGCAIIRRKRSAMDLSLPGFQASPDPATLHREPRAEMIASQASHRGSHRKPGPPRLEAAGLQTRHWSLLPGEDPVATSRALAFQKIVFVLLLVCPWPRVT